MQVLTWNKYGNFNEIPENKKLVVYRGERRKFSICTYKEVLDEEVGYIRQWITEYSTCHECRVNDHWMELPELVVSHTPTDKS
jgi:hypothetical protein